MKKSICLLLTALVAGIIWGQKPTIAEENLAKTSAELIGKWEVLRSGSQAEAKKIGIVGDYIEFTSVTVYPKPVHPSLRSHYKIEGYGHGMGSYADNKERFQMLKGDASYDPTTNTWSFGFQLELMGDKPGEKRLISKSGLVRGSEMLISTYGVDKQGDPYSAFDIGVKLPAQVPKD